MGRYRQFVRPDDEVTPAALALGLDRPQASSRSSNTSSKGAAEENPRWVAAHRRQPSGWRQACIHVVPPLHWEAMHGRQPGSAASCRLSTPALPDWVLFPACVQRPRLPV